MTILLGRVIFSGVTLFVYLKKEEIISMHGDKMLIFIGLVDLGVPSVAALWVPGVVSFSVPSKVAFGV